VFIAATNGDNRNIMAAQLAKHAFNVNQVLCRIYDPVRAETYRHGEGLEPPAITGENPLWGHQLQAYHFGKDLPAYGLWMDMGTGKSRVAIDLMLNRDDRRMLIVAPVSMVGGWPNQFREHAGRPTYVLGVRAEGANQRVEERGGVYRVETCAAVADRVRVARAAAAEAEGLGLPFALVTNYEAIWRPPLGPTYRRKLIVEPGYLMSSGWDTVLLDEVHKICAPGGVASRFAFRLGRRVKRRMALSGTPMRDTPLDIYGVYRFLDPTIFGTRYETFRDEYAVTDDKYHRFLAAKNPDEFNRRIYSIGFRVMSDDVLDLPSILTVERTCVLGAKARKMYDEIDEDFYAEYEDLAEEGQLDLGLAEDEEPDPEGPTVTIGNILVKLLRQQQITSGHITYDDKRLERIDTAKRALLKEVFEEIDPKEPVVVSAKFIEDLDIIREVCAEVGRRYGECSGRDKGGLTPDSTMRGDIDVIGLQVAAGSAGINLTRACKMIEYSTDYSRTNLQQRIKRIHRPGQERPVLIVRLIAERTRDRLVYKALEKKGNVIENLLSLIREEYEEERAA